MVRQDKLCGRLLFSYSGFGARAESARIFLMAVCKPVINLQSRARRYERSSGECLTLGGKKHGVRYQELELESDGGSSTENTHTEKIRTIPPGHRTQNLLAVKQHRIEDPSVQPTITKPQHLSESDGVQVLCGIGVWNFLENVSTGQILSCSDPVTYMIIYF